MSNNTRDGNENFWPPNQQVQPPLPPPHHYAAHAQHQFHQQLHQTLLQQPVVPPQLLPHPQHLSYAVPTVPVVAPSGAPYYHGAAGMVDGYGASGTGFSMHHGAHQPLEDEYSDAYGQAIKVVYQPQQHQASAVTAAAAAPGMMPCGQEDPNQNHVVQDKQGYELFSNNSSFMLAAPGFGFTLHNPQQQQQQQQQQQEQPQQQQQPMSQFSSMSTPPAQVTHPTQQAAAPVPQATTSQTLENGNNSTSSLISQLVGNWAPTISGTYGNGPSSLVNDAPSQSVSNPPVQEDNSKATVSPTKVAFSKPVINPVTPNVIGTASQAHGSPSGSPSVVTAVSSNRNNTNAAAVYNQQNDDNSAKLDQNVNKKQRIVAEVKPMRMSYSDVLSKNVPSGGNPFASNASTNGEMVSALPATFGNGTKVSGSGGPNGGSGGKSKRESKRSNANGERKSMGNAGNVTHAKDRIDDGSTRKADRTNGAGTGTNSPTMTDGGSSKPMEGSADATLRSGQEKGRNKSDKTSGVKRDKGGSRFGAEGLETGGKKGRSGTHSNEDEAGGLQNCRSDASSAPLANDETEEERGEDYEEYDSDEYDQVSIGSSETSGRQDKQQQQQQHQAGHEELPFLYNVKKNTNGANDTHIEKINPPRTATATTHRKGGGGRSARAPGKQPDKPVGNQASGKRSVRSRKNQKYAFLEKLLLKWLEYTMLALHWLWSLVSDVVYLSARLAWDYVLSAYQYCRQHVHTIRQDFGKNSGRPGAWFRRAWQSFDGHFAKESRWAFWRRCRKQKPAEPPGGKSTPYRDGRLPSTADEAMSSLLNCKGKDAYSILGVSPDCSQEQIRKHYKKIAVLVHPDKNKQPGAEEAFKVLQRSFELIGEPESRKEYDQSLAEALNAEKAWSEINDLLTQLHTKISEAANTIRCSSCCLRHPRKPTGRAHYAARECSSCKIRHPAREGDIWAETSFLGLRWKYLAMMEGNVYDITEWANCQKGALSHLQPNSHIVQYRIVLGSSSQQQQQQQQQQQHQPQHQAGQPLDKDQIGRSRKEPTANEPNLDDFLNNIYAGQNQQASSQNASSRRRYRRN
uniref:Uncharacterized protein n=1 Tax=Anopheles arabiensis TaxID=7173 RepID=A0A1I8JTK9_ANOAR